VKIRIFPQAESLFERENARKQSLRCGGASQRNTVAAGLEPDGYNTETMDGVVKFQAWRGYNLLTVPSLKHTSNLLGGTPFIKQLCNGLSHLFYQRFLKIAVMWTRVIGIRLET
jgi:hypothetical protein